MDSFKFTIGFENPRYSDVCVHSYSRLHTAVSGAVRTSTARKRACSYWRETAAMERSSRGILAALQAGVQLGMTKSQVTEFCNVKIRLSLGSPRESGPRGNAGRSLSLSPRVEAHGCGHHRS